MNCDLEERCRSLLIYLPTFCVSEVLSIHILLMLKVQLLRRPMVSHARELLGVNEVFHRSSGEAFSVRAFIAGRFDQSVALSFVQRRND